MAFASLGRVTTPALHVAYEFTGEPNATPVILLHGFPYDVRAFDDVAPIVAARGAFALAPYLRGFGPTSFRDDTTMRSGQQAALGQDLLEFMDAMRHRYGLVDGDPRYQHLENLLAHEPPITVTAVVLESGEDGVGAPMAADDRAHFTGPYEHRRIAGAGHNVPQEAPEAFAEAVASLLP